MIYLEFSRHHYAVPHQGNIQYSSEYVGVQINFVFGALKQSHEVLYLQLMIPPKCFEIFSPVWGMLRRSRRDLIFL